MSSTRGPAVVHRPVARLAPVSLQNQSGADVFGVGADAVAAGVRIAGFIRARYRRALPWNRPPVRQGRRCQRHPASNYRIYRWWCNGRREEYSFLPDRRPGWLPKSPTAPSPIPCPMLVDTRNLVENEVVDLPEAWQQRVRESFFPSELLTDHRAISAHLTTRDQTGRRLVGSLNRAGT